MQNIRIFAFADEASASVDGQISAMKRNALEGVELRGTELGNVSDLSYVAACLIRQKLNDAGLKVWSLGSPMGKIGIEDDFTRHLEKFRATLEISKVLGAQNIRMFSFYVPKGREDEYRSAVIDRIGRFVDMAADYDITLCHENEKGVYGDNAERCLDLLKTFPQLRAVFDPANFVQCGVDTLSAWEMLKPYVRYMHIKDALADGRVVPAGAGVGNVARIAGEFIAMGGREFTVEPHLTVFKGLAELERDSDKSKVGDYSYPDSDTAFDAACDAFKKILKGINP